MTNLLEHGRELGAPTQPLLVEELADAVVLLINLGSCRADRFQRGETRRVAELVQQGLPQVAAALPGQRLVRLEQLLIPGHDSRSLGHRNRSLAASLFLKAHVAFSGREFDTERARFTLFTQLTLWG